MISQTTEYALRAIVFLAQSATSAKTAVAIAEGAGIPVGYLSKIMQGLAKAGLVRSQRGPSGGFTLVDAPRDLSVYAVVHAIDPIERITACPVGDLGHGTNLCPLHRALDNTILAVETAFRKLSIQGLIDRPQTRRPLCAFPCHAPAK